MGKKEKRGTLVVPMTAHLEQHELITADYLVSIGKGVTFISPVRTKGVRTPDIFMDGCYWEMKSPTKNGRWAIENILKKAVHKSENVVLDIGRIGAGHEDARIDARSQFLKLNRLRRLMVIDSSGRHEPIVLKKR